MIDYIRLAPSMSGRGSGGNGQGQNFDRDMRICLYPAFHKAVVCCIVEGWLSVRSQGLY